MILVTGATGTTSRYVLKQLSAKGKQVRALVRDAQKARGLAVPNVEFFEADFDDRASLENALVGIDRAYLLTPTTSKRVAQEANFLKAAKVTNLEQIVRLSILGAELDSPSQLLRRHGQADDQLKASDIPFTILKPSYFMQNLLWYAETIKNQGVFHASLPRRTKHSHIDARDVAAMAATVLTESGHINRTYRITGPEALTYDEMMFILSQLLGKPVRYDSSLRNYTKSMENWGLDVDEVLELDRYIAQGMGDGAEVTNTVAEITKKDPIPFKQFIRDHLSAFREN